MTDFSNNFNHTENKKKKNFEQENLFWSVGKDGTFKSHSYYQWIYLFLIFQACCFSVTRLVWKNYENNTLEMFLQNTRLSKTMNSSSFGNCPTATSSSFLASSSSTKKSFSANTSSSSSSTASTIPPDSDDVHDDHRGHDHQGHDHQGHQIPLTHPFRSPFPQPPPIVANIANIANIAKIGKSQPPPPIQATSLLVPHHTSPNLENEQQQQQCQRNIKMTTDHRFSTKCSDSRFHEDCQYLSFQKGCILIEKNVRRFANQRLFVFRVILFVNFINLIFMFFLFCRFFGFDSFTWLGVDFLKFCAFNQLSRECSFFRSHTFPFFSKCIFFNIGPSGSMQTYDSLCLLTANGVNFVVCTVFWFWFVGVAIYSIINTICFDLLYFQPCWFFRFQRLKHKAYLTPSNYLKYFCKSCPVGVMFFLDQVYNNSNPLLFAEFIDYFVQESKMK